MDLQGEVHEEPHGLTLENDHQNSDSEGSSNYTLAPTYPAMPPPPDETFQTREELIRSAKIEVSGIPTPAFLIRAATHVNF